MAGILVSAGIQNQQGTAFAANPAPFLILNQAVSTTNSTQVGRTALDINTAGVIIDMGQLILPRYIMFWNTGVTRAGVAAPYWIDIYPLTGSPVSLGTITVRLQAGDIAVFPLSPNLTGLEAKAQANFAGLQYQVVDS